MKNLLVFTLLALVTIGLAVDQSKDERVRHSTLLLAKTRKIDLLNQILPVAMNKKQLNEVLGAVEKAKRNVEKSEQFEFEQMLKLEGELDATIKAGVEKEELPSHDFVMKLSKTYRALDILRSAAVRENMDTVRTTVNRVLNAGQIKAAANCIDATYFDPSLKPEELTTVKKLDVYIRVVLLDPNAYDILTDLFKSAKS